MGSKDKVTDDVHSGDAERTNKLVQTQGEIPVEERRDFVGALERSFSRDFK